MWTLAGPPGRRPFTDLFVSFTVHRPLCAGLLAHSLLTLSFPVLPRLQSAGYWCNTQRSAPVLCSPACPQYLFTYLILMIGLLPLEGDVWAGLCPMKSLTPCLQVTCPFLSCKRCGSAQLWLFSLTLPYALTDTLASALLHIAICVISWIPRAPFPQTLGSINADALPFTKK